MSNRRRTSGPVLGVYPHTTKNNANSHQFFGRAPQESEEAGDIGSDTSIIKKRSIYRISQQQFQNSARDGLNSPAKEKPLTMSRYRNIKKATLIDPKNIKSALTSIIQLHLVNVKHSNKMSIMEILQIFCETVQTSIRSKNERQVMNQMLRFACYNPKIKEFLTLFSNKPSTWTPDYLVKTMIQQQVDSVNKFGQGDGFRKFKLDPSLIDAVLELSRRLEEQLISLQEDQYIHMAQSLINQNYAVEHKTYQVKNQLFEARRMPQLQHLKEILGHRQGLNIRAMETNICERLFKHEERFGRFNMISGVTRNASTGLDTVVEQLKINPIMQR